MSVIRCMPHAASGRSTSAESSSPLAHRVKKSTPTARTSGSAKRSSISAFLVARALPAATMVAVAPTLVARSQLSLSVRPTDASLLPIYCFDKITIRSPAGSASRARAHLAIPSPDGIDDCDCRVAALDADRTGRRVAAQRPVGAAAGLGQLGP